MAFSHVGVFEGMYIMQEVVILELIRISSVPDLQLLAIAITRMQLLAIAVGLFADAVIRRAQVRIILTALATVGELSVGGLFAGAVIRRYSQGLGQDHSYHPCHGWG